MDCKSPTSNSLEKGSRVLFLCIFTVSFTILCETWTFYFIIRQQMAKINEHVLKERLSTNSLNVLDIQTFLLLIHGKLEILKEIAIAQKELPN